MKKVAGSPYQATRELTGRREQLRAGMGYPMSDSLSDETAVIDAPHAGRASFVFNMLGVGKPVLCCVRLRRGQDLASLAMSHISAAETNVDPDWDTSASILLDDNANTQVIEFSNLSMAPSDYYYYRAYLKSPVDGDIIDATVEFQAFV